MPPTSNNGHHRKNDSVLRRSNSVPINVNARISSVLKVTENIYDVPVYNPVLLSRGRQNTPQPQIPKSANKFKNNNIKNKTPVLGLNAKLLRNNLIAPNFSNIKSGKKIEKMSKNYYYGKEKEAIKLNSRRHFVLATMFLCGGFAMFASFDSIMDFTLDQQMQIKHNRILPFIWKKNPMAIHADFYLFGLTNAEAFLRGAKPIMQEYGPFTFEMYRTREVLKWGENTVKFIESYDFVYNDERAVVPMNTPLQTLNYPLIIAINSVKKILTILYVSFLDPIVSNIVTIAMRATGETVVEQRTAEEVLMGRKINLISFLEAILQPMRDAGIPIPKLRIGSFAVENSTFGFVALLNTGIFGPFESFASTKKTDLATHFYQLKGSRDMPNYKYPCNQLFGSGGMIFGRHLNSSSIAVYNQLVCRTLIFKKKRIEYFHGIRTIRYELDEQTFSMNSSRYRCFCYDRSLQECDGWTNAAGCFEGIDIGMSMPHFLNSALRQSEIGGLKPNASAHLSYFNIEPNLGVPLNAALHIQGNLPMKKSRWVPALSRIPDIVHPVFWLSIHLGATTVQSAAINVALNCLFYGSYGILLGSIALTGYQARKGLKKRNLRIQLDKQMSS